jgi:hypothetical protein
MMTNTGRTFFAAAAETTLGVDVLVACAVACALPLTVGDVNDDTPFASAATLNTSSLG